MSLLKSRVRRIVLDWDETITEQDTMSILATASSASPDQWQGFVDAYMQDMKRFEDSFGPRVTLQAQFEYLGGLADSEMRSVHRIEAAKVFRGVTHQQIRAAAGQVKLRFGFREFCLRNELVETEILSVNWSREFIRYTLDIHGISAARDWLISANQIEFDEHGHGTGAVSKDKKEGMRTALDKLSLLKQRIQAIRTKDPEQEAGERRATGEGGGGDILVYIGDSNTDLPALLEADLGIIFGDNESLQHTCDKFDISIVSFSNLDTGKQYVRRDRVLYRARSWDEIVF